MKTEKRIRDVLAKLEPIANADAIDDPARAGDDDLLVIATVVTALRWVLDLPSELDDSFLTHN